MAAVTICSDFGAQKNKVSHCFHCFPIYFCHELMGLYAMIFIVWMLSFNPAFHSPFSLLSKGSLVPLRFLPLSELLSRVWLFETPWMVDYQALASMEFSRQEYWSGLLFPSPWDLPNPGIKPRSPTLQADTLPSEPPGKPFCHQGSVICISEIIDISPSNLGSSLCFIQPDISHDVLCV